MAKATLTVTVAPVSGIIYTAGSDCILTWVLDTKADGKEWTWWKKNRIVSLDVMQGDGGGPEIFTYYAHIESLGSNRDSSIFLSGWYDLQDDDANNLKVNFTLPQGLAAGNYQLRVGDWHKNVAKDGRGDEAIEKKVRGTTALFEVDADKELTFTAPLTNSDWNQGEANAITWGSLGGWDATDTLDIYYRKEVPSYVDDPVDYPWTLITSDVDPTDVTYTWNTSPELDAGEYQIGIIQTGADTANLDLYIISAGFMVTARSVTFTAPVDDDDVWVAAASETISWTCVGFVLDDVGDPVWEDDITLYYRKNNDFSEDGRVEIIYQDADNDTGGTGSYAWTLPSDIAEGDYRIVAVDNYDVLLGTSGLFSVEEKAITFTNPNSGSYWHITDNVDIAWTYDGYAGADTIKIEYAVSGDSYASWTQLAASVALSTNTYEWNTTGRVEESYKIRITRGSDEYTSGIFSLADAVAAFKSIKRKTRLIAVADDKVFYENDSNQMTQVPGATIAPVTPAVAMIPAYQKVFIGDGLLDGLYFVDMANVKVTGAYGGGEVQFTRGEVLSGGGVTAIFDHGDATNIYIYRTTSHTVVNTDDLVNDGSVSTFTASANEFSPPFWLTWTANDGLGSLPDSATIGGLYRGRIVLAGDRKNPHMWYMSRAGDPFDWLYAAADAASPIAGGDGDVGEVGDVITSVVPYHDDYLIMGCNQSLWLMRGDPAAGGSLDSLTSADGMFGPNSWCFDANNILHYVGLGGVYYLVPGELPKSHTTTRLPSFMSGINREQHWITMAYDVRRHGINITITKVDITTPEDYGTSDSWWLDLRTGGFFPETYPQDAAPFSSLYFGSEDSDYEHLLLGCHDGQIRRFDDSQKDDEGPDSSNVAIDAYVLYPPQRIGGTGREGKLNKIAVTPGGGGSDSDSLTYEIYVGDTAQKILNDSAASATPHITSTITGVDREIKRPRARGNFAAIKVKGANATGSSFAIESIVGEVTDGGRIK